MILIENEQQFDLFKQQLDKSRSFWIPVYSDQYKHYVNNRLSFIYIYLIDTEVEYIISFHHKDCISLNTERLQQATSHADIYILGKKQFLSFYSFDTYDANLVEYFQSNNTLQLDDTDTPAHDFFNKKFYNETNVNDFIPIVNHYEKCFEIKDKFMESFRTFKKTDSFDQYNSLFIDNLYAIERNGLRIDYNKFVESFQSNNIQDNTVHTEYNIYTTTGRPSNRYGGVNYAALNKEDGARKSFVSRFQNGMLVEFDFDSYHLRLIADIVGYKFPEGSVHEYFGKQYFGKDVLTEEEYAQSKQASFKLLYGGVTKEFENIEFFKKVKDFSRILWNDFQEKGYIKTAIVERKMFRNSMTDMNPSKLFNYFLQALETEYSITVIQEINDILQGYDSKIILYTYDSFLFDFNINDGKDLLMLLRKRISDDDRYPVKIHAGKTYHHMMDMSDKVQ